MKDGTFFCTVATLLRDFVPARPLLTQGPPSPAEATGFTHLHRALGSMTERDEPPLPCGRGLG